MIDILNINALYYYKLFFWEDIVVVFLIYNFIKNLVVCLVVELIWVTHFFNRRLAVGYLTNRKRAYVEFFLKLRSKCVFNSSFSLAIFNSLISK